jgi:hypothetical protein
MVATCVLAWCHLGGSGLVSWGLVGGYLGRHLASPRIRWCGLLHHLRHLNACKRVSMNPSSAQVWYPRINRHHHHCYKSYSRSYLPAGLSCLGFHADHLSLTLWGVFLLSRVYFVNRTDHDESVCNWRLRNEYFPRSEHI